MTPIGAGCRHAGPSVQADPISDKSSYPVFINLGEEEPQPERLTISGEREKMMRILNHDEVQNIAGTGPITDWVDDAGQALGNAFKWLAKDYEIAVNSTTDMICTATSKC